MDVSQQDSVRLADLDLFSGTVAGKAQEAAREIAQAEKEVAAFFEQLGQKGINAICSIAPWISRRGHALFCNDQNVQSDILTGENCLQVCKVALSSFPITLNGLVASIKSGASRIQIEQISQMLCKQFNTAVAFEENAKRLQSERAAFLSATAAKEEAEKSDGGFSETITIPFGKSDSGEISLGLRASRPEAHAVVTGMSGSGKSSLLQSLILCGAYKYPPDKLQFWLLDFKDGTGLIQFKALKHVRMMSLKNRPIDASEIMDYIEKEYARRAAMIRESGGGDIRDYNRRAQAGNKPLLPRLIIIIDEFTAMPRACFSGLNGVVKRGRSMGMCFIFSAQIIETGAAYGDTVQQANHFFEFKNSDSAFGRLVKNVSEEERQFACSGIIGNCIYRRDTEKTAVRVAYAGDLTAQTALIQKINDKWSDFPYREPIVTGEPERKIQSPAALACDIKAIRDVFERTKKVLVPIGESRTGEPYLYKIDRDNPLLVVFGDDKRVASVEFSVIGYFKGLTATQKAVYYLDLNCNPDREPNAVTAAYGKGEHNVVYTASDEGAKKAIDEVYEILQTRRALAREDRTQDIGNPIELIVHNAERIPELKAQKRPSKVGAISRNRAASVSADMDLQTVLSAKPEPMRQETKEEDDIGTVKKLSEIIENGKNSRIYVLLYFEEKSRFSSLVNDLFTYNYDFKDVLVVPRIPDDYEELSYSEVTDSLSACRLREQASQFEQNSLMQSDFICAVLVDEKVSYKLIPYEWNVQE